MFSASLLQRGLCTYRKVTRIKSLFSKNFIDKEIRVQGRVRSIRQMKSATFLDIDDGSTASVLQVVVDKDNELKGIGYHCGLTIRGVLKESKHPKQEFELLAHNIEVESKCDAPQAYPFALRQSYTPDYARQFLTVRPRLPTYAATLRIRSQLESAVSDHMKACNYIKIHTPLLTSNNCEGGSDAFRVVTSGEEKSSEKETKFFKKDVFLTVSAQMHLEALAQSLTSVYTMNPTFRAEPSYGRHHLAEFCMLEAEEAFLRGEEGLSTIMQRVETLVKYIISNVLENCSGDLSEHWKQNRKNKKLVEECLSKDFKIITYKEAVEKLSPHSSIKYGEDLSKQDELKLTEIFKRGVFVTHWPKALKPFYMAHSQSTPDTVLGFDLLLPQVGEVVGGSVRESSYENLLQRSPPGENLDWYLQLRNLHGVSTAGYGLGVDRVVMFLTGVENIKDVVPFPRSVEQCQC